MIETASSVSIAESAHTIYAENNNVNLLAAIGREEDGATAVEYAVMLALLIAVCIGVVRSIGTNTRELMDPSGQLTGAMGSSS